MNNKNHLDRMSPLKRSVGYKRNLPFETNNSSISPKKNNNNEKTKDIKTQLIEKYNNLKEEINKYKEEINELKEQIQVEKESKN